VARDGLSFSALTSTAIAALKIYRKRSHTLEYCSRYSINFRLALAALVSAESFLEVGHRRKTLAYWYVWLTTP